MAYGQQSKIRPASGFAGRKPGCFGQSLFSPNILSGLQTGQSDIKRCDKVPV
jgi:hypothetical protein